MRISGCLSGLRLCLVSLLVMAAPVLAEPVSTDLTPAQLQEFDRYVESSRQAWKVPGMAVALIQDGKVIFSKGYGVREVGKPDPVTDDTIFQIGSISKSFTSTLVGLEVDRGKLDWKDKVVDHYPEFRTYDPWVTREFTIEDTMAQRSGQSTMTTDLLAFMGKDRDDILGAMRHVRPVSSFRSEFAYVNNMWLTTAKVLEEAVGKSWEQQIADDIFTPLGMTSSSSDLKGLFDAPNHASPHHWDGRSTVLVPREWPYQQWCYTYGPAGGINSNVHDMARYLSMHMGRTPLLSPASRNKLHSAHTFIGGQRVAQPQSFIDVGAASYCQGWLRQERYPLPLVWHNGGTTGFRTVAGFVPGEDLGIVVLSNTADSNLSEALMMRYYDMALGQPQVDYSALWLASFQKAQAESAVPKRPASPRPPQKLALYAGSYSNPIYGTAEVKVVGSKLHCSVGPLLTFELQPWDGDTFNFADPISPANADDFATFVAQPDGSMETVRISLFSDSTDFQRVAP